MDVTKDTFFKPEKLSAADKADRTDSTARQILAGEAMAREKKTEALRALRLAQQEANEAAAATAAPRTTRKAPVRKAR